MGFSMRSNTQLNATGGKNTRDDLLPSLVWQPIPKRLRLLSNFGNKHFAILTA
jgi:hypothetical protein